MAKPYMPLMVGDWLKGTNGMTAQERGVYLNLLLHQHENGFIPADIKRLNLIDSEVGLVWVSIKDKFEEFEPGKFRNKKLVEVLAFWEKQGKNGKKGGRPKKENPKPNPNNNPKPNHHNDYDLDYDINNKLNSALDEIYLEGQKIKWQHIEFDFEVNSFKEKVRGSPDHYQNHDSGGIRLAFQSQLRNAKKKQTNGHKKGFDPQAAIRNIYDS